MFAKLLKHEWKATSGLLGIVSLAALGVGALLTALIRFANSAPANMPDLVWAPVSTIIVGGFLAIAAYAMGTQIVLLMRFYKNKFSDEGYLTFTLPVTAHQILLSSLLNYLIWTVISVLVVVAAFAMVILVGSAPAGSFINREVLDGMSLVFKAMLQQEEVPGFLISMLGSLVVTSLSALILVHAAITMGAVIAKKHKILAAFGCYYGFSMILGIINSVLTVGIGMMGTMFVVTPENVFSGMNVVLLIEMVIYLAVAVSGYFLTHYLMKNKLNLP
jgi:hypothetical protein